MNVCVPYILNEILRSELLLLRIIDSALTWISCFATVSLAWSLFLSSPTPHFLLTTCRHRVAQCILFLSITLNEYISTSGRNRCRHLAYNYYTSIHNYQRLLWVVVVVFTQVSLVRRSGFFTLSVNVLRMFLFDSGQNVIGVSFYCLRCPS